MLSFLSAVGARRLIVPGIIVAAVTLGVLYFNKMKEENDTLRANEIILNDSIQKQQAVIARQREEAVAIAKARDDLQVLAESLTTQAEELRERFEKVKPDGTRRDVGKLAIAKDTLLERVINRGTERALSCFEDITSEKAPSGNCAND